MSENKKEKAKKKVWLMETVKKSMEGGVLCTIDKKLSLVHEEHLDW